MLQLLYKYFLLYNKAAIPGIGSFCIERQPARLDYANKVFIAPVNMVAFEPDSSAVDPKLYTFVSVESNIEEETAVSQLNEFGRQLKNQLLISKTFELPGFGTLIQKENGNIEFTAIQQIPTYFPAVPAERVIRLEAEHNILVGDTSRTNTEMQELLTKSKSVKDYWWVFAIILALIGIAALVYYYMQNGSFE